MTTTTFKREEVLSSDFHARLRLRLKANDGLAKRKLPAELEKHLKASHVLPFATEFEQEEAERQMLEHEHAHKLRRTEFITNVASTIIKSGEDQAYAELLTNYNAKEATELIRESYSFLKKKLQRDLELDYTLAIKRLEDLHQRCRDTGDHNGELKALAMLAKLQGLNSRLKENTKSEQFREMMRHVTEFERGGTKRYGDKFAEDEQNEPLPSVVTETVTETVKVYSRDSDTAPDPTPTIKQMEQDPESGFFNYNGKGGAKR